MNKVQTTGKKKAMDKLYFESICCACCYAPLPPHVDQGANRFYTEQIEVLLPGWFEDRNIPVALKHYWMKLWVLPTCREMLLEGGFASPVSDVDFFTSLPKSATVYLIGRFMELKAKNNAFTEFLSGGAWLRQPNFKTKSGFLRRFRNFLFNQSN